MQNERPNGLTRATVIVIAIVQGVLGAVFLLAPDAFARALALPAAPAWTHWIFAMFGARAIGFAYGMARALREPSVSRSWFVAMIGVQAIDWIGTLAALASGEIGLAQATTAPFLPVLFVAVLAFELRRRRRAAIAVER